MSARDHKYDSKLVIHRKRKIILGIIVSLSIFAAATLIHQSMLSETHWLVPAAPLIICGFCFVFYPVTEYWQYDPWQSRPRRIEQSSER